MNLSDGVQSVSLVILSAMIVAAAMGVVLLPNIVYSAFLLGGVFVSVAGLYLLLNADFVAAAQVLIYVGAVNVLILFAIMLVNKRQDYPVFKLSGLRNTITALVSIALFTLLAVTLTSTNWTVQPATFVLTSTLVTIAKHFFYDYLLPFELASVLLLVALIGAIVLARREFIPETIKSSISEDDSLSLLEKPREQLVSTKP
ncbi:NADH:ubiquinone oxidoreductase subunit 6 (chain J) [Synechococcus sp. PCC 7502]|uniref:NADH-quinone oxidoreductase subunit J n=1 Tax=Synechococcus sp. PCC 7502 TaxID=1173263 RepID=UPI00029FCF4D|nr:NADH-quinone oxidoreductase subunit J [Synechococcus sp. PCC 7502]AFY73242.1 NADH:ubiquinone oxidoreductase subunit 6 (chain J) [Synechococcus sp. PCC 7502]